MLSKILSPAFAFLAVLYHLIPLLSSRAPAGWDTSCHFYLAHHMGDLLARGHVTGYDPLWYAGYPSFTLYQPLAYVLAAGPYFLSGGIVSIGFGFNLLLVLTPILFLVSLWWATRSWLGSESARFSWILGALWLLLGRDFSLLGMGIHAATFVGLVAHMLGLALSLTVLGLCAPRSAQSWGWRRLLVTGFVIALVLLCHSLSALFLAACLGILVLCAKSWRQRGWIVASGLLGIALSAWWLVPFLDHLELSSAAKLAASSQYPDPLFALFPEMNPGKLQALVQEAKRGASFSSLGLSLPWTGILFLSATLFGVAALARAQKWQLLVLFFGLLIVLPRDFFPHTTTTPLHYYRFTQSISGLMLIIAAGGLVHLSRRLNPRLVWSWAVLTLVVATGFKFDLKEDVKDPFGYRQPGNFPVHHFVDQYSWYADAEAIMEEIAKLPRTGRVATESAMKNQYILGSPHFFSAMLPLKHGIPVLPGLLSESALSAGFVNPMLSELTDSMLWGRTELYSQAGFTGLLPQQLIERLGFYNVEYLLVSTRLARRKLAPLVGEVIDEVVKRGEFMVYRLRTFRPRVRCTNGRPFLFLDSGGMSFRMFFDLWFSSSILGPRDVFRLDDSVATLREDERAQFAGIIVALQWNVPIDQNEAASIEGLGLPVIYLNDSTRTSVPGVVSIADISDPKSTTELEVAVRNILEQTPNALEVPGIAFTKEEAEAFEFDAHCPVVLGYSYTPRWQVEGEAQRVFLAAPSFMGVLSSRQTRMRFVR